MLLFTMDDDARLHWFRCALRIYIILISTHRVYCGLDCEYCVCCAGRCLPDQHYICDDFGCKTGFWNQYCTNRCSQGCAAGLCDRKTGQCSSCHPGRWGELCDRRCKTACPTSCNQLDGVCITCRPGTWGKDCLINCNIGCSSQCQRYDGHCSPCKDKTWGHSCQDQCPVGCKDSCFQNTGYCTECIDGYWGNTCQKQCQAMCKDTCNQYNGYCSECKYGYWGDSCDQQCGQGCASISCARENGYCLECSVDFWGDKCDQHCGVGCASICEKSNGYCSYCKSGYWGQTCDLLCGQNCLSNSCHKVDGCLACATGYWGNHCEQHCPAKCYGACDKTSGNCLECDAGLWGKECKNMCSKGCSSSVCNISDGGCSECAVGYWGNKCDQKCSTRCKSSICNKLNGQCSACNEGYWGIWCDGKCPDGCKQQCSKTNGFCLNCSVGQWGDRCEKHCPVNCISTCTQTSGSCLECKKGNWGGTCDTPCGQGCQSIQCEKSNGYCSPCKEGYWGDKCESRCRQNCKTCISYLDCTECKNGYFGKICASTCIENCQTCTSVNECTKCRDEYWGTQCRKCNAYCNDTCDTQSGYCTCKNGYFSAHSRESECYKCPLKCQTNSCNSNSGNCQNGCKVGYWGMKCNNTCSSNCNMTCSQDEGQCFKCETETVYGPFCDQACSQKCLLNKCEQENGICIHGCIDGFIGEFCDTETATASSRTIGSVTVYAVIGGLVGGVFLLVLVGVVVLIWKKRSHRNRQRLEELNEQPEQTTNPSPVYATVNKLNATRQTRTTTKTVTTVVSLTNPSFQAQATVEHNDGCAMGQHDDIIETDEDDEVARAMAIRFEAKGGVYYNNDNKINNEKVAVADIAQYVAERTMSKYEEEFEKLPYGLIRPYKVSQLSNNLAINRYTGIYPYDDSRVKVKGGVTDYINASYIDGYKRRNEFIATLGPMKKQLGDYGAFWRMVWQQNVETIVMLTKLKEGKIDKCEQYWPNKNTTQTYGDVTVTSIREDVYAEFTHRSFRIKMIHHSELRVLHHMHFTSWPDRGVPHDVITLVDFRYRVMSLPTTMDGPVIVHCSAGIGRTGTYIALDILTKEGLDTGRIDVPGCVLNMRQNRPNMIQTLEQYRYLHHALVHTLTLPWEPVKVDYFPQYMQQNKDAKLHEQFKTLQGCTDPVTKEEEEALSINKGRTAHNRPNADIPGDERRPILRLVQPLGAHGYVNAVYINGAKEANRLLLAQTPLPATVDDFLLLAVQEHCSCIVNMHSSAETKNKDVGDYIPADNQTLRTEVVNVSSTKVAVTPPYYTRRSLEVTLRDGQPHHQRRAKRTIPEVKFTSWEEGSSVPGSAADFVGFVKAVNDISHASLDGGPILVHCLNAAERCGLFSAVCLLLEQVTCEGQVNVINTVRKIRAARPQALNCQEQFDFCHECVLETLSNEAKVYINT